MDCPSKLDSHPDNLSQTPRGVLRISSDRDDRMGAKIKSKKTLGLLKKPWKVPSHQVCKHYHKSSDCFEYPTMFRLKLSHPKNSCQIVLTQKNTRIKNKSFDHLSLEIWSTPLGSVGQSTLKWKQDDVHFGWIIWFYLSVYQCVLMDSHSCIEIYCIGCFCFRLQWIPYYRKLTLHEINANLQISR